MQKPLLSLVARSSRPRSLRGRLGLAILALLLSLVATKPSSAHDLPQERTILLQLYPTSIEAMIVYQEPPGRRVDFFLARFDTDRDGTLTGPEAEAAGKDWIPHALQGLTFQVDGEPLPDPTREIKFKKEHNGALSSAILLTFQTPRLDPGQHRTISVTRAKDAANFTSLLNFRPSTTTRLTSKPQSPSLTPGSTLQAKFQALQPNELPLPTAPP